VVVALIVPDVAVTVTVYGPVVVPGLLLPWLPPLPDELPPPQLMAPPASTTSSMSMRRVRLPRRRTAPIPNSNRQAKATAPCRHCPPGVEGEANDAAVAAVVEMVRVAVWLPAPVIVTGDVAPKLNVGASTAPEGELVRAAVRVTAPVNPPDGATVIVEAFPVVAPGASVTAVPATVRPGTGTGLTITGSLLLVGL
jgi:hypothetical protein